MKVTNKFISPAGAIDLSSIATSCSSKIYYQKFHDSGSKGIGN
jgi:hypothetical protein